MFIVRGGKVMPLTQREMVKLLEKHGWTAFPKQGKGSHIKMKKPGYRSIPIPKGELKPNTERAIREQAGIK